MGYLSWPSLWLGGETVGQGGQGRTGRVGPPAVLETESSRQPVRSAAVRGEEDCWGVGVKWVKEIMRAWEL